MENFLIAYLSVAISTNIVFLLTSVFGIIKYGWDKNLFWKIWLQINIIVLIVTPIAVFLLLKLVSVLQSLFGISP